MPISSMFRNPADLLIHDHFHLKDLFADYERLVPGEQERLRGQGRPGGPDDGG